MATRPAALKPVPKKAEKKAESQSWSAYLTKRAQDLTATATKAYSTVAPYVSSAADAAWALGATALLLAIPVIVEVQRETTVMVMQKQREVEMQQMQEQTKMSQPGLAQTVSNLREMFGTGQQQAQE